MKKYFLTTAMMGALVAPAFGEDIKITESSTCNIDVLGTSENNATANVIATWVMNKYTLNPGEYLSVTETSVHKAPCPAGSYCVGGTEFTVDNANTSIAQCPTGYENSDAGAGADTQCYTACTVDMVAKATAVTGNDYYDTGVDTCGATACETGYHVDGGGIELVEKTLLAPISLTDVGDGYRYANADGTSNSSGTVDAIPADSVTAPNTWAVAYSDGVVYGKASCQPKGNEAFMYILSNANAAMGGSMSIEEFRDGLEPLLGPSKTEYIINVGIGMMDGSKTAEDFDKALWVVTGTEYDANYSTDSTGQYCYCQMDGFTPTGGTKEIVTSAPWVFIGDIYGLADLCAPGCADLCANALQYDSNPAMRASVFGALEAVETGGMCKITENNCPAGQYLAIVGDAMMCVPCKTGSYCPGGVYTIESENKGTNICPSGYPNSDAGASADTQCYTACSVDMVAHATAVSGNDYYGTGVDTCGATACETGYHVNGGGIELVEKAPLVPISLTDAGAGYRYVGANGTSGSDGTVDAIPADSVTAPSTWATAYSDGVLYGKASCQPKADAGNEYIYSNILGIIGGTIPMETARSELEIRVGASKAEVYMGVLEAALAGDEGMSEEEQITAAKKYFAVGIAENANYSTDSTGQYCYCQMDGFMPTGGTREIVTSAPWVFRSDYGSAAGCASNCADYCADYLRRDGVNDLAFRGAVVGALDLVESGGTCAANVLNIVWDPANNGAVIENQCTYNESITVPADPVKPGYEFVGWKVIPKGATK